MIRLCGGTKVLWVVVNSSYRNISLQYGFIKKQHAFVILYFTDSFQFSLSFLLVTCLIEKFIGYVQIILKLFSVLHLFYGLFLKINNYTNYCSIQKKVKLLKLNSVICLISRMRCQIVVPNNNNQSSYLKQQLVQQLML